MTGEQPPKIDHYSFRHKIWINIDKLAYAFVDKCIELVIVALVGIGSNSNSEAKLMCESNRSSKRLPNGLT